MGKTGWKDSAIWDFEAVCTSCSKSQQIAFMLKYIDHKKSDTCFLQGKISGQEEKKETKKGKKTSRTNISKPGWGRPCYRDLKIHQISPFVKLWH